MIIRRRFSRITVLLMIFILPVACSTPQPTTQIPPTATSTPIPPTATETAVPPTATVTSTPTPLPLLCEGVDGICVEFRFEPGRCRRVGPETVPAGEITLIFSNYSGEESGVDLEMLDEGKTYKDMLQYMGGLGAFSGSQPEWSVDVANPGLMGPGRYYESQKELTAGIYIAVCWTNIPHRIFLADGGLVVEE